MDSALISLLSVPATGLLAFLGSVYKDYRREKREERQRSWDREDREETRAAARELTAHAAQVAKITEVQTGQLLAAVADNTKVSSDAFTEANGYNAKIAQLHSRMDTFETILRHITRMLEQDKRNAEVEH